MVDHSAIDQIFEGMPHLQAAQLQSPYLLHNLVERMKIEKMHRNDALAVMMRLKGKKGGGGNSPEKVGYGRPSALDSFSVDSILSGHSLANNTALSRLASDDEEDRVRVVTIRTAATNGEWLLSEWSCDRG